MAASQHCITINVQDEQTLDYLTKAGYEVRLSYPDEHIDWFSYEPDLIRIDSTDNVSPVRESPIKVIFTAFPEVKYWMTYALPGGEIQEAYLREIELGQIYEVNSLDTEPRIITGDDEENWAPENGFGFHNGISASPVLYRTKPGNRPQPSTKESRLSVWVPGTGIILPSNQVQVWFETPLKPDASDRSFTTADQSVKFVVPFKPEEFDVEVRYSEKEGWELSAGELLARQEITAPVKAPVIAPVETVSERAAPNGIPTSVQTTKKLAARKRVVQV